MPKIAFIGAGSHGFTRNLVRDILSFPALAGSTLMLMDIDDEALDTAALAARRIVEAGGHPARVLATRSRTEALDGADGVVCTIRTGDITAIRAEYDIPARYGISINIGDTRGPSGVFRFLRTLPVMLDICRDIEALCPRALFLNYTNPMSMLCAAMQRATRVNVVGMCHSVQHTAAMLGRWIGAPAGELSYTCAGINHQAWFLGLAWRGADAYPLVRRALERPDVWNEEQVRNEMFGHFGYYVTESSGHASEYVPWFRKRADIREKYCTHGTGINPGREMVGVIEKSYTVEGRAEKRAEMRAWCGRPVDLARGDEYAAPLFNAVFGDGTPYGFNGNVRNDGLIANLPDGSCVEVPVLASRAGVAPRPVGALPAQLAPMNAVNCMCDDLAVTGGLALDRDKVLHAITYDPLTAAVLSLDEIRAMVDDMFRAGEAWLPRFSGAVKRRGQGG